LLRRHKVADLDGTLYVSRRPQAFVVFSRLWNRWRRDLFKHSLDGADDRSVHHI